MKLRCLTTPKTLNMFTANKVYPNIILTPKSNSKSGSMRAINDKGKVNIGRYYIYNGDVMFLGCKFRIIAENKLN